MQFRANQIAEKQQQSRDSISGKFVSNRKNLTQWRGVYSLQSTINHRIFPSFLLSNAVINTVTVQTTPSRLFSLTLMFDRSKSESLRDVSVTRISDILSYDFPQTVYVARWKSFFDLICCLPFCFCFITCTALEEALHLAHNMRYVSFASINSWEVACLMWKILIPVGGHFHINLYGTCRFSGYHFSA